MTQSQKDAVHSLRLAGYSVTIFSPTELQDVNPRSLENRLVELGNEAIDDLRERTSSESNG